MKWVLNIIQFLIVYLFVFYLIKGENVLGLDGIYANNTLITGISIGIAGALWRLYNRFSLFIIKNIKSINFLHTTFFGYLPKRWKRLARVLSFVFFPIIFFLWYEIDRGSSGFVFIIYPILIILISYTLKPFLIRDSE